MSIISIYCSTSLVSEQQLFMGHEFVPLSTSWTHTLDCIFRPSLRQEQHTGPGGPHTGGASGGIEIQTL